MPPERSSAQERRGGGLEGDGEGEEEGEGDGGGGGRVVYAAMRGWRSQSPAVSCVRKDMPA